MERVKRYIEECLFLPPKPLLKYLGNETLADFMTPLTTLIYEATGVPSICVPYPGATMWYIYSHGNNENLESAIPFVRELSVELRATVFVYEYPGYFHTEPPVVPSEALAYRAAEAYVKAIKQLAPFPVILIGYSMGCALALHAAEANRVTRTGPLVFGCRKNKDNDGFPYAVVLIAPFVSAASVVLAREKSYLFFTPLWQPVDVFALKHAALVHGQPTFVASGVDDAVIPWVHGETIATISAKFGHTQFLKVPNATHKSVRVTPVVWSSFKDFLKDVASGA